MPVDFLQCSFHFVEITTRKYTHLWITVDRRAKTDLFFGREGNASEIQVGPAHIVQRLFCHQSPRCFRRQVKDLGSQPLPQGLNGRKKGRDGLPDARRRLHIQAVIGLDSSVHCHGHISLARAILIIGEFELLNRLIPPGLPRRNLFVPIQVGSDQVVEKGFQLSPRNMALEGFFFPAV